MKGHYCGVPSGGAERCVEQKRREPHGGGSPVQLHVPLPLGLLSSLHTPAVPPGQPGAVKASRVSAEAWHGILAQRVHP